VLAFRAAQHRTPDRRGAHRSGRAPQLPTIALSAKLALLHWNALKWAKLVSQTREISLLTALGMVGRTAEIYGTRNGHNRHPQRRTCGAGCTIQGISLVKRLPQSRFAESSFDSAGFNLHQHVAPDSPCSTLIVLVHGLAGRGYGTWGSLPQRLFDSTKSPTVDIGVYEYRTFLRGIARRTGKWEFWVEQLAGQLHQIESRYSNIFLVGHSMGGLLIEALTKRYLQARAMEHAGERAGALAALVLISSPRAGSGWASFPVKSLISEIHTLKRLNPRQAEVDEFFATYVERRNAAVAPSGLVIVPVYAALGAGDKLVSQFSAAFGVPNRQRLYLEAGHKSIVKPKLDDTQLIDWLYEKIVERLEVRAQAARQRQHEIRSPPVAFSDPRTVVITRFVTDSSGLLWEQLYNEARRDATTTTMVIRDVRELANANVDIDLLIAVHAADLIVATDQSVQAIVLDAYAQQQRQPSMSVGVCPVGVHFQQAEQTVRDWLAANSPSISFYVEGAAGETDLRQVLARLLQVVVDRDPAQNVRATLADDMAEGAE